MGDVFSSSFFFTTFSHFSLRLAGVFGRFSGFSWELSLASVSLTFRQPDYSAFFLEGFIGDSSISVLLVFLDLFPFISGLVWAALFSLFLVGFLPTISQAFTASFCSTEILLARSLIGIVIYL